MKKILTLLTILIGLNVSAWAVDVTITMSSSSQTMTLATKDGVAVDVGSPTAVSNKNQYSFSVDAGTYVLTAINSSNTVDGTIEIPISDDNNTFQLWTVTCRATNSGWTVNTDYTIENYMARTREGLTLPVTLGTTGMTSLVTNGGTFNCTYVPSATRKAEGYVDAYGSATFTFSTNVNAACPKGGTFTVSYPSTANFMLMRKEGGSNGSGSIHYTAFPQFTPETTTTSGGVTTVTYTLGESNTYNYRLWQEGKRTKAAMFCYSSTDMNSFTFTNADLDADPKAIDHDPASNLKYNVGGILVNINERGHLRMTSGQTKDLIAQRDWQLTNSSTANYFIEPDYHYSIVNLEGTPITIDNANTTVNPWATLHANSKGTALVLVNYDAIHLTQWTNKGVESDYLGGADWGACWPENTAVYVVTVDEAESSADPKMLINEKYNDEAKKNSGKYVDAEHDVFYYFDTEEGAKYTFTPSGVSKVEIAYPTILANTVAYNDGFQAVNANADGSYTLLLKFGRNVVKMTDADGAVIYQVLTAKPMHREITNVTRPGSEIFQPGDQVKIQHSGLYHPANKMSGIYNMSAYVTFNGTPNGTALILGANQYNFAGTPSAQAVTVTIPTDWDVDANPTYDLTEGVLQVKGYGDPIGNHRLIDKVAGRSPNFTAVVQTTYFGQIPDVNIPITAVKYFTVTPSYNITDDVTLAVKDASGADVTANADGTYSITYGTYSYTANADGYKQNLGSFTIADDSPDAVTVNVTMEAIPANGWDGSNTSEPEIADGVYQIKTGAELAWFANNVNTNKNYTIQGVLCNDIDLCGFSWTPIGGTSSSTAFTGTLDGAGYSVKGLYINATTTYRGLFGYVGAATIKDLTVEGSVTTTANYSSGIVAYALGTTITGCVNKVNVSGKQYVGGITGYAGDATTIDCCANYGDMTASGTYVAGITPYIAKATGVMTNCFNAGTVTGNSSYTATLVANENSASTVKNCLNIGELVTEAASIGNVCAVSQTRTNVSNNYVIKHFGYGNTYETVVTDEQLASGEVAYNLGDAWGQEIGVDAVPVIGGMKVYFDMLTGTYTNEDPSIDYTLAVLTFEDKDYKGGVNFAGKQDWSSLIDDPQYGGTMLYGDSGMGVDDASKAYNWTDENNTWLHNMLSEGYGTWCYWSGGHAISNYGSGEQANYGDYTSQLTVFHKGVEGLTQTGNGHNGSDNFAVHYGYADNSGWGLGEEALPALTFSDGIARVIDHMYVNNTCYAINCYIDGNGLTDKISESDWVKIVATGYNGDTKGNTAEIYLCNGPSNIIMDWTKFDLSCLGEVTKVTFNITGSSDNGYGFSQPAYFAYDDVAVRMPKTETLSIALNAAGYGTFSAAKDMAIQTEGVKAYKASVSGNTITLTELDGYIPAGTGVLLYGEDMASEEVTFATPAADDEAADVTDNDLQPTTTATTYIVDKSTISGTVWALGKANKFLKYSATAFVANRAYLVHDAQNGAKSMIISFDGDNPTDISNIESDDTDDATYNLAGQRVNSSAKGIVIKNGKKYLIK